MRDVNGNPIQQGYLDKLYLAIDDCCKAEYYFSIDELEEFANEINDRTQKTRNSDPLR